MGSPKTASTYCVNMKMFVALSRWVSSHFQRYSMPSGLKEVGTYTLMDVDSRALSHQLLKKQRLWPANDDSEVGPALREPRLSRRSPHRNMRKSNCRETLVDSEMGMCASRMSVLIREELRTSAQTGQQPVPRLSVCSQIPPPTAPGLTPKPLPHQSQRGSMMSKQFLLMGLFS